MSRSNSIVVGCVAAASFAITASAARAGGPLEPRLVRDINPGNDDSLAEMFVPFNGAIYFRATDGTNGTELWRTDGTTAGTQMVTDLRPGPANGFPGNLTVAGGSLYFNGYTEPTGSKVFRSDGTAAGTQLLIDTFPGMSGGTFGPPLPDNFTTHGNLVLFSATDPQGGYELWRTDGTTAGTARVKDIHPGEQWSVPVGLTPFNGKVYFAADDLFTPDPGGGPTGFFDRELFVTDGTADGTVRVKDINPGPMPSIPIGFRVLGSQLLFTANDGTNGSELWASDGTTDGTRLLQDINPTGASNPMHSAIAGSRMFFNADDGTSGAELWVTDGTDAGTRLVKDVNPSGESLPLNLTPVGNRVFFSADDGTHGTELWVSDGTADGTRLVKDINVGDERSSPLEMIAFGDQLFFTAIDPNDAAFTVRTQLWVTDGTEEGTQMLFEEPGDSFGYAINHLTLLGNELLFTAPSGEDPDGFSINVELHAITVPEPGAATALLGMGALARRRGRWR
jgi:ELWxxDGT repeat protein